MIHQYINNGYYIVLDVNSGSVHSVDPLLYDVISFLSERIPDSEKPFQIAQSLKAAGRHRPVRREVRRHGPGGGYGQGLLRGVLRRHPLGQHR